MVKSRDDVIAQFNDEVNMSAEELEEWLEDPQSRKAGTGVGIESGQKIVEILRKNPSNDPKLYDEDDIEHMRKVVGYTKRHLAQEDHLKETKTREELENAKSTISLKNWGHDPVKSLDEESGDSEAAHKSDAGETDDKSGGFAPSDESAPPDATGKTTTRQKTETQKADSEIDDQKYLEERKRKLDDGADAAGVDEEEVDELEEHDANDDSENQENRPRKRSKVDDA